MFPLDKVEIAGLWFTIGLVTSSVMWIIFFSLGGFSVY